MFKELSSQILFSLPEIRQKQKEGKRKEKGMILKRKRILIVLSANIRSYAILTIRKLIGI